MGSFKIAKETVDKFIADKQPFSWSELQDAVIENGGVFRVAPGCTLGQYLDGFSEKRIIFYNNKTKKFHFTEEIKNLYDDYLKIL